MCDINGCITDSRQQMDSGDVFHHDNHILMDDTLAPGRTHTHTHTHTHTGPEVNLHKHLLLSLVRKCSEANSNEVKQEHILTAKKEMEFNRMIR